MRRMPWWLLILLAGLWLWQEYFPESGIAGSGAHTAQYGAIEQAFAQRQSDIQVVGEGTVIRVLPQDNDGRPHQRFILALDGGHTVLIAHNLTLADPLPGLRKGDRVEFFGEYEWNDRGGVIHWTHDDPAGRHVDGWLEYRGRRYQ